MCDLAYQGKHVGIGPEGDVYLLSLLQDGEGNFSDEIDDCVRIGHARRFTGANHVLHLIGPAYDEYETYRDCWLEDERHAADEERASRVAIYG